MKRRKIHLIIIVLFTLPLLSFFSKSKCKKAWNIHRFTKYDRPPNQGVKYISKIDTIFYTGKQCDALLQFNIQCGKELRGNGKDYTGSYTYTIKDITPNRKYSDKDKFSIGGWKTNLNNSKSFYLKKGRLYKLEGSTKIEYPIEKLALKVKFNSIPFNIFNKNEKKSIKEVE